MDRAWVLVLGSIDTLRIRSRWCRFRFAVGHLVVDPARIPDKAKFLHASDPGRANLAVLVQAALALHPSAKLRVFGAVPRNAAVTMFYVEVLQHGKLGLPRVLVGVPNEADQLKLLDLKVV